MQNAGVVRCACQSKGAEESDFNYLIGHSWNPRWALFYLPVNSAGCCWSLPNSEMQWQLDVAPA